MKQKVKLILGALSSLAGLIMCIIVQAEIEAHRYFYTFRPPYTPYEARVMIFKCIGWCLLICGLIDLGVAVASCVYASKHTKEIHGGHAEFVTCPKCLCKATRNAEKCPRCGHKFS